MTEVSSAERNLATLGIFAGLVVVMDALSNHLSGENVVLGAEAGDGARRLGLSDRFRAERICSQPVEHRLDLPTVHPLIPS